MGFSCVAGAARAEESLWSEHPAPVITRVLLSGFEPFGSSRINSSWEAIKDLPSQVRADLQVRVVRLPVEYDRAAATLLDVATHFQPQVIVAFGLAPGGEFRLEREAYNQDATGAADNAGVIRLRRAIIRRAPRRFDSGLPLADLAAALDTEGLPHRYSDSAGRYVCNNTFYHLMHADSLPALRGFVHVPEPREDHGEGLEQARINRGVRAIIEALLWRRVELSLRGHSDLTLQGWRFAALDHDAQTTPDWASLSMSSRFFIGLDVRDGVATELFFARDGAMAWHGTLAALKDGSAQVPSELPWRMIVTDRGALRITFARDPSWTQPAVAAPPKMPPPALPGAEETPEPPPVPPAPEDAAPGKETAPTAPSPPDPTSPATPEPPAAPAGEPASPADDPIAPADD